MAHKTLINGTAYEVNGGRTLVNGTGYKIDKGRILVNGTGYDISFATYISSLAVGTSVYLKVNGTSKEFLIVNQGIPSNSNLYDESCNGTWLLMKDVYEKRQWNSSKSNSYKDSTIHTYLNGTFLNLFDSDIRSAIKQVKIPYVDGTGKSGSVASGANGLSTKVFLLGGYEVNWTQQSASAYFPVDGACLSYFSGTSVTDSKRVARLGEADMAWWLRSPNTYNTNQTWYVLLTGTYGYYECSYSNFGIRPALVLPSNAYIDKNFNVLV